MKYTSLLPFGISCYRSFGKEIQLFPSLGKINLIIGQNNSGKSNVLRFLNKHYSGFVKACSAGLFSEKFAPLDNNIGSEPEVHNLWIGLPLHGKEYDIWLEGIRQRIAKDLGVLPSIEKLIRQPFFTNGDSVAWFPYISSNGSKMILAPELSENAFAQRHSMQKNEWQYVWSILTNKGGGDIQRHWIPETLPLLSPVKNYSFPGITFIPAVREVGPVCDNMENFSGSGLIEELAKLQNPDYNEQELKEDFENINVFLQTVTGNPKARIEIPANRGTILAHIDGKTLPLESLGTGIHEVIILAAAASLFKEQVICMEEPEIHLHPTLQKKLVRYLEESTSNQYFIATHSAHLLDAANNASIYHIALLNGTSTVRLVHSAFEKSDICFDLGYRASDILQSNCIIWVEGPSDRIYIKHWIDYVAPTLVEGTHYSIMFYGGRNLFHLSVDDPDLNNFISLRKLNRNAVVVMDSDKANSNAKINETKKRIIKEFSETTGLSWVTKGREIENYIPHKLIKDAIFSVHNDVKEIIPSDPFTCAIQYKNNKGITKTADKIKVARYVASKRAILEVLDLKKQITSLVEFIKNSNHSE